MTETTTTRYPTRQAAIDGERANLEALGYERRSTATTRDEVNPDACDICASGAPCVQQVETYVNPMDGDEVRLILHGPAS